MSDHELSPEQYAASVGLSAETLERAAEAVYNASVFAGCDCEICQQEAMSAVRAALPVLVPALTNSLKQRIAELEAEVRQLSARDAKQ